MDKPLAIVIRYSNVKKWTEIIDPNKQKQRSTRPQGCIFYIQIILMPHPPKIQNHSRATAPPHPPTPSLFLAVDSNL